MCHSGNIRAILESLDGRFGLSLPAKLQRGTYVVEAIGYVPTFLFLSCAEQRRETDRAI